MRLLGHPYCSVNDNDGRAERKMQASD